MKKHTRKLTSAHRDSIQQDLFLNESTLFDEAIRSNESLAEVINILNQFELAITDHKSSSDRNLARLQLLNLVHALIQDNTALKRLLSQREELNEQLQKQLQRALTCEQNSLLTPDS